MQESSAMSPLLVKKNLQVILWKDLMANSHLPLMCHFMEVGRRKKLEVVLGSRAPL